MTSPATTKSCGCGDIPWRRFRLPLVAVSCVVCLVGCDPPRAAWSPVTPQQLIAEWTAATSVVGKTIDFSHGSDAQRYRVSGWTGPDPGMPFTWSEGHSARLLLPVTADSTPLRLTIKLGGMVNPPELMAQDVQVYVNGIEAAQFQASSPAEFEVNVPPAALGCAQLQVEFRLPRAVSPLSLGHSVDSRVLGIYLFTIAVARTP